MKSLLESLLSQIRESGGNNSQGMGSGSFRPMTDQERGQRGIDPRDPNKFSIDDEGRVMSTLIGWNPNNQVQNGLGRSGGSPMASELADQMSGGRGGSMQDALDAADKAAGGGRPNFSRPIRNLPNGASLEKLAGGQANKAIPKAKPNLQRVSPGMYRDAKGNLVRK
jgi:hypothetical protein